MATITITIKTDNAAFGDNPVPEVSRILNTVIERIEMGGNPIDPQPILMDMNGNRVGIISVTGEE